MANTKISALTELSSAYARGDLYQTVDVSDTTMAPTGTNKKTTLGNLLKALPGGVDEVSLGITGASLTGSNASSLVSLAGTWNTSGTPTALLLNITDTASNAASLLADYQVGGASIMSVAKSSVNVGNAAAFYSTPVLNLRLGSGSCIIGRNGAGRINVTSGDAISTVSGWGMASTITTGVDISFQRIAAGIGMIAGATSATGAALQFIEQTAPAAPAANGVRIYAQDNGGGKTQLMALFATGAAQQIAIEP